MLTTDPYVMIQRLIKRKGDAGVKLVYDYMGSSNFEMGACLLPRAEVCNPLCAVHPESIFDTNAAIRKVEVRVPHIYMEDKEKKKRLFELFGCLRSSHSYHSAEVVEYRNIKDEVGAWLMIYPVPLLLYESKHGDLVQAWIEEFRKPFIGDYQWHLDELRQKRPMHHQKFAF